MVVRLDVDRRGYGYWAKVRLTEVDGGCVEFLRRWVWVVGFSFEWMWVVGRCMVVELWFWAVTVLPG